MSQVISLVIKPSNIKLTFKSQKFLQSHRDVSLLNFCFVLFRHISSFPDNIPGPFEGTPAPHVCILVESSACPQPQPGKRMRVGGPHPSLSMEWAGRRHAWAQTQTMRHFPQQGRLSWWRGQGRREANVGIWVAMRLYLSLRICPLRFPCVLLIFQTCFSSPSWICPQ